MFKQLGQQLRKPSGTFGKVVSKMLQIRNKSFNQKIIKEVAIQKGDKIYEIGYGPGQAINLIARQNTGCSISGIDFSELMYEQAVKRNKKYIDKGIVNLTFGDLPNFEAGIEKYNKIFCVNVIYFWSDLNEVFQKIYSMMVNDGIFCIYMAHAKELGKMKFTQDFNKYTIEAVEIELKNTGFVGVEYT